MKKTVPVCTACEHFQVYGKYRDRVRCWCKHSGRSVWIPSKERGNTSPQWCPKRITYKLEG